MFPEKDNQEVSRVKALSYVECTLGIFVWTRESDEDLASVCKYLPGEGDTSIKAE